MDKKVFIYSIPRETSTKISDWTSDISGRRLKKTKIGKCNDKIQALYSPKVGGLLNGLSYKPWMEDGKQKKAEDGTPLTLQDKLEQEYNLPKGYLTNRSWKKGDSRNEEKMTYFQKQVWVLNDGATVLDLNEMDGKLGYLMMLDHKLVANSEEELRAHKWPKATHYIALENESEQIKYKKNQLRSAAFSALHHKDMTLPMKRKFVRILELSNSRSDLTEEQIHNLLFEYINNSNFQPGNNIDKFNELTTLLSTATGREELEARDILQKALNSRVVYEKQGTYSWPSPEGNLVIGEKYSEAIDFLLNPKKQGLVEDLIKEIKAKTVL